MTITDNVGYWRARAEAAEANLASVLDRRCVNCGGGDSQLVMVHNQWVHKLQVDCIVALQSDREILEWQLDEVVGEKNVLRGELDNISFAAHMPDNWPHGLASWINQRLYAAYIGAYFSDEVRSQIMDGRLTFGEA